MDRKYIVSVLLMALWLVIGLVVDEVRHVYEKEDFFLTTPHLIIYSGMAVLLLRVLWVFLKNRHIGKQGFPGTLGYGLVALLSGGIGDTILHVFFDVQDESIWSRPTHILILLGVVICMFSTVQRSRNEANT